jgi:glutaminase
MAVIPGQVGVGVYSPPLDAQGNSVRGIKVCQDISNEFELHVFNNRTNVRSVIRRVYHGDRVRSSRLRTTQERNMLDAEGVKIAVIEVQGALFFGSTEQLLRRIAEISETARYIVVDFKRVHLADSAARKLILKLAHAMRDGGTELLFAELANDGPLATVSHELAAHEMDRLVRVFRDVDAALEWCEDQLLVEMLKIAPGTKFALAQLDVFKGMSLEEYRLLETIVSPLVFDKGEIIIREGDQAKLFFVLARGSVSVQIKVPTQTGEKRRRVASLGPGLTFGEMALFHGGSRSAAVVADEKVICYGLAVEQLKELAISHPNVMVTILAMTLHELATNAVKYGALSAAAGQLNVSWKTARNRLLLTWEERGAGVALKRSNGFGMQLIDKGVRHNLGGDTKVDFRATGLYVELNVPLEPATGPKSLPAPAESI